MVFFSRRHTPLHLTTFGWWIWVIRLSSPHNLLIIACWCKCDEFLKTFPATVSLPDTSSMTVPYVPLPSSLPVGLAFLRKGFSWRSRAPQKSAVKTKMKRIYLFHCPFLSHTHSMTLTTYDSHSKKMSWWWGIHTNNIICSRYLPPNLAVWLSCMHRFEAGK